MGDRIVVHNILSPLLAEEARLEGELRRLPVYLQLEAVRSSIASLKAVYGQPAQTHNRTTPAPVSGKLKNPDSITSRVVQIAASAMRTRQKRVKSSEVLGIALREGIEIASSKPQSVVASILSHEQMFDNKFDDHGAGYGLREWTPEQPEIKEMLDDLYGEKPPSNEQDSQRETAESP
jgi:hypothetical protein